MLLIIYVISEENKLAHFTWKCHHTVKLVKCKTFSSDWRFYSFLQTLVALKRASCGLVSVAQKRTCCDAWQLECQASKGTASVQNNHLLHGYMLPLFFDTDQSHSTPLCAEFNSCCNKPLPRASTRPYQYTRSSWSVPHDAVLGLCR